MRKQNKYLLFFESRYKSGKKGHNLNNELLPKEKKRRKTKNKKSKKSRKANRRKK